MRISCRSYASGPSLPHSRPLRYFRYRFDCFDCVLRSFRSGISSLLTAQRIFDALVENALTLRSDTFELKLTMSCRPLVRYAGSHTRCLTIETLPSNIGIQRSLAAKDIEADLRTRDLLTANQIHALSHRFWSKSTE